MSQQGPAGGRAWSVAGPVDEPSNVAGHHVLVGRRLGDPVSVYRSARWLNMNSPVVDVDFRRLEMRGLRVDRLAVYELRRAPIEYTLWMSGSVGQARDAELLDQLLHPPGRSRLERGLGSEAIRGMVLAWDVSTFPPIFALARQDDGSAAGPSHLLADGSITPANLDDRPYVLSALILLCSKWEHLRLGTVGKGWDRW